MTLNRRAFMAASSLAAIGSTLPPLPAFAQRPAAAPVVPKFATLRRNVGTFEARGGIMGWLITSDAVVVVDSQFPDTAATFLTELKPRSARQIDLLINSHHHPDHTGGNKTLRPAVVKIVAHENCVANQRRVAAAQKSEASQAYADEIFAQTWKADAGDEVLSAKYYGAGHTGGDVAILFERANVVHMGDLMSHYRHPRADLPSGASVEHWITVLEAVVKDHSDDTIYIYGHSKPGAPLSGPKADLLVMRDYFTGVLDYVRQAIAAGRPAEDVAKSTEIPGFPQHAGDLTYILQATYDELSRKA